MYPPHPLRWRAYRTGILGGGWEGTPTSQREGCVGDKRQRPLPHQAPTVTRTGSGRLGFFRDLLVGVRLGLIHTFELDTSLELFVCEDPS